MTYICIFGEYSKKLSTYLDSAGFMENKPCTTDNESEYRADYITDDSYKEMESDGSIVVSFKMKNGTIFAISEPFGSTKYYTYCDIVTYEFIKRKYGEQVIAVITSKDTEKYINQLEESEYKEYIAEASLELDINSNYDKSIVELERYIGRKQNENMFKMYDNND